MERRTNDRRFKRFRNDFTVARQSRETNRLEQMTLQRCYEIVTYTGMTFGLWSVNSPGAAAEGIGVWIRNIPWLQNIPRRVTSLVVAGVPVPRRAPAGGFMAADGLHRPRGRRAGQHTVQHLGKRTSHVSVY